MWKGNYALIYSPRLLNNFPLKHISSSDNQTFEEFAVCKSQTQASDITNHAADFQSTKETEIK